MLMLLASAALLQAHGADPVPAAQEPERASVQVSEEAKQTLARMRVPDGFHVEVFASEPLVANPVAFCFDVFGRVFVAETFRHSKGVTDMREHMDWLEDDLAIKTVEDRVAMFLKHEGEAGLREGYAVETERVRRIVDTDGDGVADTATVFADGFTDPAVGIAAGLLARRMKGGGTELWYTCIPDLWRLIDADDDGVAETRIAHSSGYGLRVALLGHDLHGLIIGPDGRMYFSIGDRGFNVTTADGVHLVRYGMGAVFRCELDGSGLEIFCDGLRNPQELVFDELGNLFTLDNNSDGGDKARWTWLLEGSDTGWRQAYQWIETPNSRGPWNAERIWYPYFDGQPYYALPPIENFTSGPSGITRYPGVGWGEAWRDTFFVCDFRGNPGYSGIYSYKNARHLSGFKLASREEFLWDALPTDVDFGIDGDLYVSDWINGWNQTGKGRIWRIEMDERPAGEAEAIVEVQGLLQGGIDTLTDQGLVALFEHRDRRVRQEAQLQLASRALSETTPRAGYEHLVPAMKLLREPSDRQRARLHALWCAWQVARNSSVLGQELPQFFVDLLADPDSEIVAQAARVLGDLDWRPAAQGLAPLLAHEDLRVRLFGAQALGAVGDPATSVGALVALLDSNGRDDPWIRTAAIRALERLGNAEAVHEQLSHATPHVRQALAVVLRRWKDAAITVLLDDEDENVRAEAVRAIYDTPITDAMGGLAAFLERAPAETSEFTWRRMIHANRAVATPEAARRLAHFGLSGRASGRIRADALQVLTSWQKPLTRDGIVRDHRPLPAGEAAALTALMGHAVLGLSAVSPPAEDMTIAAGAALVLQRSLVADGLMPVSEFIPVWSTIANDVDSPLRVQGYRCLIDLAPESDATREITRVAVKQPKSPLRTLAYGQLDDETAAGLLYAIAMDGGGAAATRIDALRILGGLAGEQCVDRFIDVGSNGAITIDPWMMIDWFELAAVHPSGEARAFGARIEEIFAPTADDPIGYWAFGFNVGDRGLGDPERGRQIFTSKSETSCIKCHVIGGEGGSEAGPDLDGVGARLTREEILLSIITPNATIAEGFESWIILTTDDEPFAGRIIEETDSLLVLETAKKEQLEFEPDEIKARRRDVSAMPEDVSTHLSRSEMRDLIAFLASLRD